MDSQSNHVTDISFTRLAFRLNHVNILSLSAFCTTRAFALKHLCQLRSYHGTGIRLLHLVSFEYLD